MTIFEPSVIDSKAKTLARVAATLKDEFYGIDEIVDRIIGSISAWYTFPELISRPVIINLWGLTGVGKTHLVRRLVQLLEFNDRFVEVQMDGVTSSSSNRDTTIARILGGSSIGEGMPGIILLDEFQRYRTVDEREQDVAVERFQDVWMLLSDGKFPASSSIFRELEMMLAMHQYEAEQLKLKDVADAPVTKRAKHGSAKIQSTEKLKFRMYPYEAQQLKTLLKLTETIQDIMSWDPTTVARAVDEAKRVRAGAQLDYTKLVVFVSGNLDEAYPIAKNVNDCDTDADIFYELTKKVDVLTIKRALAKRFRPEQISRFGNNHIIYPSIRRSTYERLIDNTSNQYLQRMHALTGITFTLSAQAKAEIYSNSVYPAQGTRPVFSSIHKIMSDGLVQLTMWAIKQRFTKIDMEIDGARSKLVGRAGGNVFEVPIDLDLRSARGVVSLDQRTLVSVHEAGHALVYALLTGAAPAEINVNTVSTGGGFMVAAVSDSAWSKAMYMDQMATLMAGQAAERLVFGSESISLGAADDIGQATKLAALAVRALGLEPSVIGCHGSDMSDSSVTVVTRLNETNGEVIKLLKAAETRARDLLTANVGLLQRLAERLIQVEIMDARELMELLPELKLQLKPRSSGYADSWESFKKKHAEHQLHQLAERGYSSAS